MVVSSIDATSFKWYTIDTAREARPEGKGRRMYRERKSRTPAKTVTHFLISCIKENVPATATNEPPSQTHNRVKPIIQELTRKVKRGTV